MKEIEEVFDEEKGKVDVAKVVLMLENNFFEENGNESAVIGEKINIVANEKIIEVKKMLKRMQMIS